MLSNQKNKEKQKINRKKFCGATFDFFGVFYMLMALH
jgi:hypothetical protein